MALQSVQTSMVESQTDALIYTLFEFDDGSDSEVADATQQATNGAEMDRAPIVLRVLTRPSHVVTNPLTNS